MLVGELVWFVDLCAYGALAFIRMPTKMSVNTLTSCKRTITAPIGRLFDGCVAPVHHSLVYGSCAYQCANIGKFALVWCIDGVFFENKGRKVGVVAIAECLCFDCVVWFWVKIKGLFRVGEACKRQANM